MFVALVLSAITLLSPVLGGETKIMHVAGAAGDWAQVAHVRIEGSWFEIGRELARLGSERHGSKPAKVKASDQIRAQREYFAARYPAQLERMRGVAAYFGHELEKDEYALDGVGYAAVTAGCTVVYYPPDTTEDGRGVLSRNFDFTTGTWAGKPASPGDPAATAPYVLELHPMVGYASLAVVAFDLLGVVDGINSAGLTVALLADDELFAIGQAHPSAGVQPGLEVLQVGRFLLDTCKDVAEAKVALRGSVFYYTSIPCHYLIADAAGRAFIWENAVDLAGGQVIEEEDGGPLVSTNYLRHLHPDLADLLEDPDPRGLFDRHRTLLGRFEEQEKFSRDEIRANAACVSARARTDADHAPGRTLWHALYFPVERRMEIDFYLGEGAGENADPRRSKTFAFSIEPKR